ncbi:MAG TPA: ATPase [Leptospiraceae bacterium]|nr:ATPase [Spirochaetaceae bacterium]HBS05727.1 ATPase [Leptospiraceae bacterium]|tara:strand:+ start:8362 stop:9927 length:1566 start_codon:yes stop_codon:yes gene_type:complete
MAKDFASRIKASYDLDEKSSILLGLAMKDGKPEKGCQLRIPLKTLNRHGLIAGATGTGKTKSLQHMAGELSLKGVPSLVMDIKGDLSGLAAPGEKSDGILKRMETIGAKYEPQALPCELYSLTKKGKGGTLRATVSEFGPILLSRILDLNETQASVLTVIMQFCDDEGLLLLDLKDLKKAMSFVMEDGKEAFEEKYGKVSGASTGTILRKVVALEQQGADEFFGERSFEVKDLLEKRDGKGVISIVRLMDMQSKPALFSTFMLQLLAEIYQEMPELGDPEKPELVIFLDEAHLIFDRASKTLLEQIETMTKLIRSKGVGLFFVTQNPQDVPAAVLSQLGTRVQHALRAVTAKDRKAIKTAAENFPLSDDYKTDRLLTELGIGEALVTGLTEKGKPTPLAHSLMCAPCSRMDVLKAGEVDEIVSNSSLAKKYNESIDRKSAYEILTEKAEDRLSEDSEKEEKKKSSSRKSGSKTKDEESVMEKVFDSKIVRDVGRTVAREITRGLLGAIGIKKSRRRKSSWF